MPLEVDVDHRVPLGLVHVEAHLVAQDAGVVDEDVEPAEGVDGLADHALGAVPRRDAVAVGFGPATRGDDLVDDLLRRCRVGPFAARAAAEVVHHHRRTFGREQQRVPAADAAPRAGDDRNLAVEEPHVHLLCVESTAVWQETALRVTSRHN